MAVTGWKSPQTAAGVDRDGKANWSNVDNAKVDDNNYAENILFKSDYGDWLRLTNFGFTGSDIPSGATINGIEVQYKRSSDWASVVNDSVVKLRKTAGQVGDNKASAVYWATSKETVTKGGATDTWNAGLVDSDIISSNFGIDLSPMNNDGTGYRARVYYCQIRIYYTAATAAYKDIATRFKLTARNFKDIATRFKVTIRNYKDIATRFPLQVRGYQDTNSRFLIRAQNYVDSASRFLLRVQNFVDIATRFRLILPAVYADIGTRFFLYVPTWKELQIQAEIADIQADIAGLSPHAHFRN
jgi:hypothetical protein